MKKLVLALAALAAGTGAALAFVWWVTAEDGPSRPSAQVAERVAAPPESSPNEPPPAERAADARRPDAPQAPVVMSPAPPKAPPGTWGAIPAVPKVRSLGPTAGAVGQGLNALAGELAACYGAHVARMDDSMELPTLVLNLESRAGEVVVVDAAPMADGGAPPEVLGCAIRTLVGRSFPAPAAKPGLKQRLIHPIRP